MASELLSQHQGQALARARLENYSAPKEIMGKCANGTSMVPESLDIAFFQGKTGISYQVSFPHCTGNYHRRDFQAKW